MFLNMIRTNILIVPCLKIIIQNIFATTSHSFVKELGSVLIDAFVASKAFALPQILVLLNNKVGRFFGFFHLFD